MTNEGPTGKVINAVSDVVGSLKSSPVLLFIMLLNMVMLGGLGYVLLNVAESRRMELDNIHETQGRMYDDIIRLCFGAKADDQKAYRREWGEKP